MPSGGLFRIRAESYVDWTDAYLEEQIKTSPQIFFGGKRGLVITPGLLPDVQEYISFAKRKNILYVTPTEEYYYSLVDTFNQSWNQELDRFFIEMVFRGEG